MQRRDNRSHNTNHRFIVRKHLMDSNSRLTNPSPSILIFTQTHFWPDEPLLEGMMQVFTTPVHNTHVVLIGFDTNCLTRKEVEVLPKSWRNLQFINTSNRAMNSLTS